MEAEETREKCVEVSEETSEDGLVYSYYSPAPAEYRLTPESRAAIAEALYERMSRNEMIRRNSALAASGIMPM